MVAGLRTWFALLICCPATVLVLASVATAQGPPPAVVGASAGAQQTSSPSGEADATYRNPQFGLSFRIPSNYTLLQGQGVGARSGDFGLVPGDSGEYLFAKLEPTARNSPYPIMAPSVAALYFGIHLGTTEEACLAPLDFIAYKSKGTVTLDGVTFRWSADPGPDNTHLQRFPVLSPLGEVYFRDYAGFTNSVCYEFHLRRHANPQDNAFPELERVLASVKLFPRAITVHPAPGSRKRLSLFPRKSSAC
jgi:hypothetical protein